MIRILGTSYLYSDDVQYSTISSPSLTSGILMNTPLEMNKEEWEVTTDFDVSTGLLPTSKLIQYGHIYSNDFYALSPNGNGGLISDLLNNAFNQLRDNPNLFIPTLRTIQFLLAIASQKNVKIKPRKMEEVLPYAL